MLARLATRLLLAPLGFVFGLLAGFIALALASAKHVGDVALFPEHVMLLGIDTTIDGWVVAMVLGPLVGAPAIVAVLIAEMFSIRSWVYHAAAGALTALLPWALLPAGVDGPLFTAPEILACGFVGGFVHWLVAGRTSGVLSPEPAPR